MQTCRMGGEPQFFVDHCPGPCDLSYINDNLANFDSASNPAATYARGQKVIIKYSRNNHGPGGMIRFTLVPVAEMMDPDAHSRNAFHYTCWGANPVVANPKETEFDRFGFSVAGVDGLQHDQPKAYYKTEIVIPMVVGDGDYILGWLWFGGTGSTIKSNKPQKPSTHGYFSDYHSCSFVRIENGPTAKRHVPTFNNDMSQFSEQGCMSMNDAPGICVWEPCLVEGRYQKPAVFKNGNPPALTPAHFSGDVSTTPTTPTDGETPNKPRAPNGGRRKDMDKQKMSCRCLGLGAVCSRGIASQAHEACRTSLPAVDQHWKCKESCCGFCSKVRSKRMQRDFCSSENVRTVCAE